MLINIIKYIFGIFLAIAILAGTGLATTLYFVNRITITPPKPTYDNDKEVIAAKLAKNPPKTPTKDQKKSTKTPAATPTATPTPETTLEPLPADAYNARVTWSKGLSLRAEPSSESQSIGGVGFNAKVIVVAESDDKVWQKIRVEGSDKEGWVKSGNTKKDEENSNETPENTPENTPDEPKNQ
jgi:hypothetical protein